MPSWAYVELKCRGGTTAPVRGSKAWPAWTARVLKPWFPETVMMLLPKGGWACRNRGFGKPNHRILVAEVGQQVVPGEDAHGRAHERDHQGVRVGEQFPGRGDGFQ